MVIESRLDPGRGAVVTVLVQRGTLKVGDALVAGAHWGRVRAMHDYLGNRVKRPARPSRSRCSASTPCPRPASSCAWSRTTAAPARSPASAPPGSSSSSRRRGGRKVSLESIFDQQRDREVMELNLVLKADVSGSLEAFEDEIALPQADVEVNIVRSGVGGITESDVNLAAASDAVIIGFNVRPVGEAAASLADREGVEIRTYSVIYRAFEDLRDAMQGMLAPEEVEETVGEVEVRAIFRASRVGTIAGSYVTDGRVTRGAKVAGATGGRLRRHDRVACGASPRTSARWPPGSSADRAPELLGHQGRRPARGLRDPAGRTHASARACPANPRSSCSCASTCTSRTSARSRASAPSSTA